MFYNRYKIYAANKSIHTFLQKKINKNTKIVFHFEMDFIFQELIFFPCFGNVINRSRSLHGKFIQKSDYPTNTHTHTKVESGLRNCLLLYAFYYKILFWLARFYAHS